MRVFWFANTNHTEHQHILRDDTLQRNQFSLIWATSLGIKPTPHVCAWVSKVTELTPEPHAQWKNKSNLQGQLDDLQPYSKQNSLTAYISKTIGMCFNERSVLIRNCFTFENSILEDVKSTEYLGSVVSCNGNLRNGLGYLKIKPPYYFLWSVWAVIRFDRL